MAYTRLNPKTETDTSVSGVTLMRHDGVCTLAFAEKTLNAGWNSIGTIPSGYRPALWIKGPIIDTGGSGACGILSLSTTGDLQAHNGTGASKKFSGFLTYKLA